MFSRLKDFFIPHAGNQYAPHSLQKVAVSVMLFLTVLTFAVANIQSLLWISSDWLVSTVLPAVIVDLTNQERSELATGSLRRSTVLDTAATLKAQHMAENEYFAHHSPDGVSPWYWFGVANYAFVHAGENLAIHFSDSGAVVDAWMNSPTHRANIVNDDFTEIGVGTAQGMYQGFTTVYVVQLFGTPAQASEQPAIAQSDPTPTVLAEAESNGAVEDKPPAQIAAAEDVITRVGDTEVELRSEREPIAVAVAQIPEESQPAVEEVIVEDDTVSVYSGLMTSSTGALPASIDSSPDTPQSTPAVYKVATQPQTVLQIIYSVLAVFVFFILLLSIVVEVRRQQPLQIAYSAALITIMGILYYTHTVLTSNVTVV